MLGRSLPWSMRTISFTRMRELMSKYADRLRPPCSLVEQIRLLCFDALIFQVLCAGFGGAALSVRRVLFVNGIRK